MIKDFKYGDDARKALLDGMEKVYKIVSKTYGAKGRCCLYTVGQAMSAITKDGVNSAMQIFLEDPFEERGCFHMKESMAKTQNVSGDGSTLTCILTYQIFKEALKYITSGSNPIQVKKGIEYAVKHVSASIKTYSIPVDGENIRNVANIALNGDMEIAGLIFDAVNKVGKDGVIACRESREDHSTLEIIPGMSYKTGYQSVYFANHGNKWIANDAYVFCYEGTIHSLAEIKTACELILTVGKPLLIIAHEIYIDVLKDLLTNKQKSGFNVCSIITPGLGNRAKDNILCDIASVTNATVFGEYLADSNKITMEHFGKAKSIIVKDYETIIIDGAGSEEAVKERVEVIESEIEEEPDEKIKERLQKRKAKLTSGVAVIHVGDVTQTALNEKKDRVDDALQSVQAALQEGIVPGGGVALLENTSVDLLDVYRSHDFMCGVDIVIKSLKTPIRQILDNAGLENLDGIIADIEDKSNNMGYDVNTDKIVDMIGVGIIDPAKVITTALQNAGSITSTLLLTESIIVNKEKK